MDVRMVDAGEVQLACRVLGDDEGLPVVLLHGLGRTGDDWDPVARDLARRHRVYAPDLRGHGLSGRTGTYSFELMRDDLGAMLEALELDRVSLVGHGTGGVVAYLYAAKHPERVDRLVLEEVPSPVAPGSGDTPGGDPSDPAGEASGRPQRFDPAVVAPLLAQLAEPAEDWRAGLDAIMAPTLLLSGGLHGLVPHDAIAAMARRISGGCLVTIPCAHEIHAARPMEFAETVDGFLPATTAPGRTGRPRTA